jgi:WD40 repeat protein
MLPPRYEKTPSDLLLTNSRPTEDNRPFFKKLTKAEVGCVAFSRDGKQALSGSADNTVRLWDVTTAKELRCFHGHNGISSVAFCPDGTASYDMTMRLWQLPK